MRLALAQGPQAERVEPGDDHTALRAQHAGHFAQGFMGVGTQLQRMGQHQQIEAVGLEWQGRRVAHQRMWFCVVRGAGGGSKGMGQGQPAVGHAVGLQRVQLGQPQLQGVEAKHIGHRLGALGVLPGQQALAGRGLQPIVQTYNFLSFLAHGLLALHLG